MKACCTYVPKWICKRLFFLKNIGIICKVNITKCRKIHDFLFYILAISNKFTIFAENLQK